MFASAYLVYFAARFSLSWSQLLYYPWRGMNWLAPALHGLYKYLNLTRDVPTASYRPLAHTCLTLPEQRLQMSDSSFEDLVQEVISELPSAYGFLIHDVSLPEYSISDWLEIIRHCLLQVSHNEFCLICGFEFTFSRQHCWYMTTSWLSPLNYGIFGRKGWTQWKYCFSLFDILVFFILSAWFCSIFSNL